jgi:hypothetical protein
MVNNSHTGFTSDLYVSSHNISDNCYKIIELLCKSGVMAVVTPKKSVICNDQKCWVENTCHIKLTGLHHELIEDRVWNPIKNEYNLDCAYLDINGYYIGCIRNFIRPSSCPTKKYKN